MNKAISFSIYEFSLEACTWQIVDALELARATMTKVYQNLAWAIAYNVVAIPIAAGVLLPSYDFAMTPSLSGQCNCFPFHLKISSNYNGHENACSINFLYNNPCPHEF